METPTPRARENHSQSLLSLMLPLRRLARILATCPDQAEDLAQDALLQVWARLQNGAEIKDLRPYLMTTLRNANRKPRRIHSELTDANTPSCPPEAWDRLACQAVDAAIDWLRPEQRQLLHPLVLHGTSYKRLAEIHNLPIGTVMSRIARARESLRADLELPAEHAVEALLERADQH